MFVEREPLRVKPDAFVHLQGRHPLGNILVNGKRQMEEILHLPFVLEIDLCDVHNKCRGGVAPPQHDYMDFARSAICIAQVVRVFVNGEESRRDRRRSTTPMPRCR